MAVNDAFSEAMIVAATRCTSGFLENERSWTWSTTPPPVDKCFSIRFSAATKANAFFSRCCRFLTSIIVQKKTTQVNITARPRLFCFGDGNGRQHANIRSVPRPQRHGILMRSYILVRTCVFPPQQPDINAERISVDVSSSRE